MAKIEMKKCDICGAKYIIYGECDGEKASRNYYIRFGVLTRDSMYESEYYNTFDDEQTDLDLCDECGNSFKAWIQTRRMVSRN